MSDLAALPGGPPALLDDGRCTHLAGLEVPPLPLPATDGSWVDLSALAGRTVLYIYPRTGRPDEAMPTDWDLIPGARGCTPQPRAFQDHHAELEAAGARVFGLSTQDTAYQQEAARRLHLPFRLLSDAQGRLTAALRLPTFEVEGQTLLRWVTLVLRDGRVEHVFFPVFPPDRNAADVLAWLAAHPA